MSEYVLWNGELLPADTPQTAGLLLANRGFRLGDSLFETMRVVSGQLRFFPLHWRRLQRGIEVLGYQLPEGFQQAVVERRIQELMAANGVNAGGKVRLQVYRTGGEGGYRAVRDEAHWLVEASPMLHNTWPTDRTQRLLIWDQWRVQPSILSGIKTGSALSYVLAARAAADVGADDVLLLDGTGAVVESGRANVFAVIDGTLVTPPLSAGILDGVLRRVVLHLAQQVQIPVEERVLIFEELARAEQVFTTNVVSGIFPVDYIQPLGRSYPSQRPVTRKLQQLLARSTDAQLSASGLRT